MKSLYIGDDGEALSSVYEAAPSVSAGIQGINVYYKLWDEIIKTFVTMEAIGIAMSPSVGETIPLPNQGGTMVYNHGIDAVIKALGGT